MAYLISKNRKECKNPIDFLNNSRYDIYFEDGEYDGMYLDDTGEYVYYDDAVKAVNWATELASNSSNEVNESAHKLTESASEYLDDQFKQILIEKLTNAYMEEICAFYAYFTVIPFLVGKERPSIQKFYEEAAKDELYDHAAWILKRISELGGIPTQALNIAALQEAQHKYIVPAVTEDEDQIDIYQSLLDNEQAESGAIETYRDIEEFTRNVDVVTNDKIKQILADEVEHLQEIEDFLADFDVIIYSDTEEEFDIEY